MSTSAPDAVVVGSGPNGLAAAIEIASAGRSVVVYEAADQIGGGTRTAELTLPGFQHDVCSAVHPLLLASPFFQRVTLSALQIELRFPEVEFAHPLEGGRAVAVLRSVDETAATLGSDGDKYVRLMNPLVDDYRSLMIDVLGPLKIPRHPLALARFGLRAIRSAEGLARRFETAEARALFAGAAAHSMLPLGNSPTAGVSILLTLLAHAVGWPVVRGGSQRIAEGMARHLESLGGSIVTGTPVSALADVPKARAVLFDVTPRQALAIAGDELPDGYRKKLERYRYGPGVFKIDWALGEGVPWTAETARSAGTVHVGGTFEEIAASEAAINSGAHSPAPYVLVAQQSVCDDSRAPAGKQTLWAYCHVPSGSTEDMTEAIESQIERFAPGFRDVVLERATRNAHDVEQHNGNYVGGDINGGVQDLRQHFFRPVVRFSPYTTPNDRLFICSSSSPPGGGVHGMCGYHAARAALKGALA
jgi:phytoene dehydrogenase-like protein